MEITIRATEGDDLEALEMFLNLLDSNALVAGAKGMITVTAHIEGMPDSTTGYWELLEHYMPGQWDNHPVLGNV